MKSILVLLFAVCIWFAAEKPVQAICIGCPFGAEPSRVFFSCGFSTVTGSFTSKVSQYNFSGVCQKDTLKVPWNSSGAFQPSTGETKESFNLNGPSPYRGTINTTMVCGGTQSTLDPWLIAAAKCFNFR